MPSVSAAMPPYIETISNRRESAIATSPLPAASPPQKPGKCLAKTSANGVVPGAVTPGEDGNVELGQLSVLNGSDTAFVEGLALK